MNSLRKKKRIYGCFLWALVLALSLVLGACSSSDLDAVQSAGEEILDSIAADMGEEALESVENELGSEIVQGVTDEILAGDPQPSPDTADGGAAKEDAAEETSGQNQSGVAGTAAQTAAEDGSGRDGAEGGGSQTSPQTADASVQSGGDGGAEDQEIAVEPGGEYSDRDHVALYIHLYGELPSNFITKSDARGLGWDSGKGNLWEAAPGKSIGGDYFGNREGLLPKKKGRSYYECDINYEGGYRGGERIVYSDDGLVYYSADHYENFELLYDEEGRAE